MLSTLVNDTEINAPRGADAGPAALYLCYQSIIDPLTLTQVVAYLEGLAAGGYRMLLLTFEPRPLTDEEAAEWRTRLADRGIEWHWRRYHKRPTLPATLWDVFVGIWSSLWLIRRHRVQLVHARSHIPGLMGLVLKRLTGVRLLFDVRGLMAEEYVDAGVWPAGGFLFRLIKRLERRLVRAADGLVVLTHAGERLLRKWYAVELGDKPLVVIPCCADLQSSQSNDLPVSTADREDLMIYVGKLGGWYLTHEMVEFLTVALHALPNWRAEIWTQSPTEDLRVLLQERGIADRVTIGSTTAAELPHKLVRGRVGLSWRANSGVSQRAASPTKVGEYLAAGLLVVSNRGIGDLDGLLTGANGAVTGVLVDPTPESYARAVEQMVELSVDATAPDRCRRVAVDEFDLKRIGWTRYQGLYRELIGAEQAVDDE